VAVKKITAEGDILLEYNGRIFIGRKLEYDLISRTGTMLDGRTSTDYWYVGGDELELLPDGSCLDFKCLFNHSRESRCLVGSPIVANLHQRKKPAHCKKYQVQVFNIPVFWIPSFKFDLKVVKDSPIRYKLIWDQVLKQNFQ
jgi:hypothetical protein